MSVASLSDLANPVLCPRLVIKIGSSLLVDGDGIHSDWLAGVVAEIAAAQARGQRVIVVSSGAVALGAAQLGFEKGGRGSLEDAQASAAVGQIQLSSLWAELLNNHGLLAGQLLLTLDDFEGRRRYLNATATIHRLLDTGVIPIINENDSVATHELRFGDNDRLAARVAHAARASAVILLSDVDGLYDRNPKEKGAKRIDVVEGVTKNIREMATGESASGMGSGGMSTKVKAAEITQIAGVALAIANGRYERPIERLTREEIGTLFLPRRRKAGARKAWLGGRMRLKGTMTVDPGAIEALRGGSSLLARGITAIEGTFKRGDPVAIAGTDGFVIAHGLSEYKAEDCQKIVGLHTDEQEDVLGYAPRAAVIHRDHLVLR